VFFSSPIVSLPAASENTELVSYKCGWMRRNVPWLIVTYHDEYDAGSGTRHELKDLLIAPMELASILNEFSSSIANAALMQPETAPSPHCIFSPVTEIWLSANDRSAIVVVTSSGRYLFQSPDAIGLDRGLKRVFAAE
jgi:hypothetical protein